jgi:RimJ/RimL family protein N-acetyltransferase
MGPWHDGGVLPCGRWPSSPPPCPEPRATPSSTASWPSFVQRGWGLWAVEIGTTGGFAGFVGLNPATFEAPFTPAVEIGWRLARPHWNQGLATEAAQAVVDYGFGTLGLDEVVSFTATTNLASQRVMQKLGMQCRSSDDFDHPSVPVGSPLRRHVLYRLARPPQP